MACEVTGPHEFPQCSHSVNGEFCVDVGEQIAFLVTGVLRELTDASRPEG